MKKVTLFKSGDTIFINLAHVSRIRRYEKHKELAYTTVVFAYVSCDYPDTVDIRETPEELFSKETNYDGGRKRQDPEIR